MPPSSSPGTGFPGVTERSVSPVGRTDTGRWSPVSRMSVRTTLQSERESDAEMADDEEAEIHTASRMTITNFTEPVDFSGWAGLEHGMYQFGPDDSSESTQSGVGDAGTPRVFRRET